MQNDIHIKHETHKNIWLRFIFIVLLFVGYFVFISFKYGAGQGLLITWITWSVFVLSTPLADAGFIIDFPVRLLFKFKMFISEIFVWLIAIILNIYAYFAVPEIYSTTKILTVFKHILDQPFPFWTVFLISGLGTFLSVKFGDELVDVMKHKDCSYSKKHKLKWRLIAFVSIFIIIFIIYDFLLKNLGINLNF